MPSRPREISSLGIYHVIFRGVAKQIIFEYDDDYGKFLTVLRKYQPICGYKIIAYCLMSNHVHLLIKPGEIPLDRIFQRIIPSFVYWYNKKYIRVGSLFQRNKATVQNERRHSQTHRQHEGIQQHIGGEAAGLNHADEEDNYADAQHQPGEDAAELAERCRETAEQLRRELQESFGRK